MAYVKEEALQKREPLVQGAELNIDGKGGKFLIRELIGAGGTSLVYDAVLVRADGSRVTGVLKEFYPQVTAGTSYNFSMLLRYMTVRRKPNGTLAIPAELRDGQRKRLEEVDSLLHEIKSEGLGLRHFIPNMEVFTCGKVPYIFTAESYSGETLAQFCKEQAWANPTSTSLRQILNTVYALACADAQLCAAGAMLLDIKPENILMVYRSTPNGLRKDAFLDTVSLFDVESVVLKSQVGSKDLMLPFSAGFTAPELGGYMSSARRNIGESADVYAMAATLFYCLTQKLVWLDTAQGYAEALQNGPFGAVLTDEQRTALGSLLARALVYEPEHRMQAPEAFAVMMEKVLHAAQTSAAEQLADRRRKMQEHLSDALAGLLYKWPLFAYGNAEDQDIRVMIVAEKSNILKQAINAVFSSCHVLGHQVHVLAAAPQAEAVVSDWMRGIDHAEDWFCYQDKPRPYNWKEKLGAVSWLNIQPEAETVRRAAAQFAPGSVLVLLDDDTEARKIAKAVPAPEAGKCLCAYTCVEGGQSLYAELDKGCVFVRLTPDDIEDAYSATAERIAFNAHLLYERQKNPSSSLLEIKHNFENFYNKSASYDTALAVKCRLFSINVPWTDDPEKDGYNFERALKEKPTAVKELAWVEHRRWVASKILNGARALPEKDFAYLKKGGANGSGTNFKKDGVLYHAYLVPSALDEVRPEGWQTAVEWRDSSRDAEIPQDLDALSHNGAALARMFAATAKKNRDVVHRGLKSFEGALEELTLELDSAAINELETHKKSLLHCIQKLLSPEARQADAAYYQIENVRINGGLSSLPPLSGYSALLPPAALLFNIVLHELSHAWAGSSFGIPADAFGVGVYRFLPFGAAFFSLLPYATVSADVGISVAGPLANLFAGSVALLLAISSQSSDSLYLAVCSYTLGCINLLPIPGFDDVSLHDMFPHQLKIGFGTVLCGLAANWAVLAVGYALCFLPWWVSFLIVLVLTVMAALLLPSRHSVCWARMLSTFCLLPVMIKSLGFELLAVSLPTAILNIGFCLLLSYLTAPVLLELIFVSYLYQK